MQPHEQAESNPYASPGAGAAADALVVESLGPPEAEFELEEHAVQRPKWGRLQLYADRLRLVAKHDAATFDLYRQQRDTAFRVHEFLFGKRLLEAKLDKKRLFRLSPEAAAALNAWFGPWTRENLRAELKRRTSGGMVLGLLFMVLSLPFGEFPFEPVLMALGAMSLAMTALARWTPSRWLFLVQAAWWLALCGLIGRNILLADWSYWWLLLVLFNLMAAVNNFKVFGRFRPERMAAVESGR